MVSLCREAWAPATLVVYGWPGSSRVQGHLVQPSSEVYCHFYNTLSHPGAQPGKDTLITSHGKVTSQQGKQGVRSDMLGLGALGTWGSSLRSLFWMRGLPAPASTAAGRPEGNEMPTAPRPGPALHSCITTSCWTPQPSR